MIYSMSFCLLLFLLYLNDVSFFQCDISANSPISNRIDVVFMKSHIMFVCSLGSEFAFTCSRNYWINRYNLELPKFCMFTRERKYVLSKCHSEMLWQRLGFNRPVKINDRSVSWSGPGETSYWYYWQTVIVKVICR